MKRAIADAGAGPGRSTHVVRLTLDCMAELGVDVDAVLRAVGLPLASLGPRSRVPVETMHRVWDAAAAQAGGLVGVRVGALYRLEQLDVVGYCAKVSSNLIEAVQRADRYGRLIGDGYRLEVAVQGELAEARVVAEAGIPEQPQMSECMVVALGLLARGLLGEATVRPREVRFVHPEPDYAADLRGMFDTPVRFLQEHNAIVFDAALLRAPLPGQDPRLATILERTADSMLAELPPVDDFARRVRQSVAASMRRGEGLTSGEVAARLGMSERSLRRRLREGGGSFQRLCDEVRYDLARRLLRTTDMEIGEVAFHLGFSNASALGRAFRRWSGVTPRAYREAR